MEKAFKLDFINDKTGSLYVNCCGCSQTEALHSFGPASKPHYLIHYVLSGKGHFRFHDKEYRLEAGYGFLIQPNELAFYQADAKDPWSYLWVGFAGSRAEEYLHSMGLSDRHPIFSCDKSEELYSIVRDMMEHNTFGIADDLRRNGLLGVFLSVIADSAGVVAREEEDKGNQYVKKRYLLSRVTTVTLSRSRMWRIMCVSTAVIYIHCSRIIWECRLSSSSPPSVSPRRESCWNPPIIRLRVLPCPVGIVMRWYLPRHSMP